jgi:ABC-type multidrug transport system ATPase subunit
VHVKQIPYRIGARLADWYHGWRDGQAGLPDRDTAVGRITTPHREALIRMALEAFDYEKLRYEQARGDAPERMIAATARLDQLYAHQAETEQHLAEVSRPLTEEEKTWRRIGDVDRPERVVIQRRQTEHRRRIAAARRTLDSIIAEIGYVEAELATATEIDKRELEAASTRVLRVHEHIHRRLNSYLRSLVRWHPHGAWAGTYLTVAPFLPGWITVEAQPPKPAPPFPQVQPGTEPTFETVSLPPVIRDLNPYEAETHFGSEQEDPPHVRIDALGTAPRHFTLIRLPSDRLRLREYGYGHGPYVNGLPVRKSALLKPGDCFDFAESRYKVLDGCTQLEVIPLHPDVLIVSSLSAKARNRRSADWGLLEGMSFIQGKSTLLAVLGCSGSGKSSLLNVLIGDLRVEEGAAYFDDLDLLSRPPQVADLLGFVPQQTDLHTSLTSRQLLEYSLRLRDWGKGTRRKDLIDSVCAQLQLHDAELGKLVSSLSGGQQRRVSIAVELLSKPDLLILDEPTSGLDPGLDREIMRHLREYAETGKTVIVTTHSTSNLGYANQVLVVAEHGRPVFFGDAAQVLEKLGAGLTYADLMTKLAPLPGNQPNPWSDPRAVAYQGQPAAAAARTAAAAAVARMTGPAAARGSASRSRRRPSGKIFRRQLWTLIRRQVTLLRVRGRARAEPSLWATVVALLPFIIAFLGALLAAGITNGGLSATPGSSGEIALSVLTTLAMLSGQALTYGDLVGDFPVIRREHRTGVGLPAVVLSKWMVFAAVAVIQSLLIVLLFTWLQPGPAYANVLPPLVEFWVDLAVLTVGAMSLGLLISALASRLEQAVAMITLTSITQIALNGVTASVSAWLNPIAMLLPDRWGLAAAASSVDLDRITRPMPQPADALWTHSTGQWLNDLVVLALLIAGYLLATGYVLHRRLRPKLRRSRRPVAVRLLAGR